MQLSYDELELILGKIAIGKEVLFVDGEFISVVHPSNYIKVKAKMLYDNVYTKALESGLLPKKDLEKLIVERGIFSKDDELKVAKLRSKIEAQEILLSKTLKVKANQDRIKNTISNLQEELSVLLYKKYSKLYMSAETKAEEEINNYMCSECVFKEDGSKFWGSYEDYKYCTSEIKSKIFETFIKLIQGIDITTIRYIARSGLWRVRYSTSLDVSDKLFGKPISDYDVNQLNLLHWSKFYDQVYSMNPADRPSDEVIEDDVLLDKFMEEYYRELNNETSILRERKIKNKGQMSAFDSEEVIVTQSNELYFDIEYDKPREAQKIKDRADIKKRTAGG